MATFVRDPEPAELHQLRSALIELGPTELSERFTWPQDLP